MWLFNAQIQVTQQLDDIVMLIRLESRPPKTIAPIWVIGRKCQAKKSYNLARAEIFVLASNQ